ncbi:MAG: ABC transporter permease [Gammaproteobacteria bacterium]|nr:ABC transporter permease [Gammaproteobacteria bacterium]
MNAQAASSEDIKSPFREFVSELTPNATISLFIIILCVFLIFFGPLISPYTEAEILTDESFQTSSESMLLGSDFLGRDILSRLLYGIRVTLSVALAISILSFFIGSTFGFMAATLGGWADTVMSRIIDALISFPSIIIALIVVSSLGSSFTVLIITVGLIDATRVFRVARALGMNIIVQDYIEAARVRGEGLGWIIFHELLPNTRAPLAAEFGIRFTYAILFISALSFLGLGVQPPHADLGLMVKENMQGLLFGSFAPMYPALCIGAVTISVNMFVDWFLKTTDATLPDDF